MQFETLSQWLDWQASLHPTAINLGLERVATVASRMLPQPERTRVITVGGTNGKGSCVRYLESILQAAGYRVGAYTSPHLERYNERVRLEGAEADDATLCAAFERVDQARNDTSLTYFEFGTLAALDIFWREQLDVVVLEVGLGGRLDAVNIVDADCAIVTNIALDHMEWLGPDRESIGREKAGIYRAARPAICADRNPPASLLAQVEAIGADLRLLGRDFDWDADEQSWHFSCRRAGWSNLPPPPMPGAQQLDDASAALAALDALDCALPITSGAIRRGIATAKLPGRFETLPGEPATILDVAHNPAAARALASSLERSRGAGRTLAVLGMLRDKAADEVAAALAPQVDYWYLAGLGGSRGLEAATLQERTAATTAANSSLAGTPWQAWQQANAAAQAGDRIVVCGSFLTVAEVREHWYARRGRAAIT
ncbi:MAG TPA: bifunctional tetrahydrofolate synthase/dihydrofolate synthase [Gammaproteobacteria bacterium]|nr:bifunctional tetrahydrofolate synthase/dihydrofolate synthase [Gammaproteobacteria bacterium]